MVRGCSPVFAAFRRSYDEHPGTRRNRPARDDLGLPGGNTAGSVHPVVGAGSRLVC